MSATASYFSAEELRERFASGGLFLEDGNYKLDAGRREAPGEVELHERVVDVMHVVEGTACVCTGGQMLDEREVAPGEIRARAVVNGDSHTLGPGDVMAIPAGVPHQFIEVSDPFLYFVVKVET
jgi:mannose-6-phosphate isomerase-like protein (cupin superfamily)